MASSDNPSSLIMQEMVGAIPESTAEATAVASAGRSDRWVAAIGVVAVVVASWSVLGIGQVPERVITPDDVAAAPPTKTVQFKDFATGQAGVVEIIAIDGPAPELALVPPVATTADGLTPLEAVGEEIEFAIAGIDLSGDLVIIDPNTGQNTALTHERERVLGINESRLLQQPPDSLPVLSQTITRPEDANGEIGVADRSMAVHHVLEAGPNELIVAATGGVYEQRGSERVKVADGIGLAASENLVLVYQCDDNLRCGMRWLDRSTGEDMGYPIPSIALCSPIAVSPDGKWMIVSACASYSASDETMRLLHVSTATEFSLSVNVSALRGSIDWFVPLDWARRDSGS